MALTFRQPTPGEARPVTQTTAELTPRSTRLVGRDLPLSSLSTGAKTAAERSRRFNRRFDGAPTVGSTAKLSAERAGGAMLANFGEPALRGQSRRQRTILTATPAFAGARARPYKTASAPVRA
jgi:hypothetical protein